jgi:hypothetical protein
MVLMVGFTNRNNEKIYLKPLNFDIINNNNNYYNNNNIILQEKNI